MTPLIKKTKRSRVILLTVAIAVVFFTTYRVFHNPSTETLSVQTFRVSGGWGYQISIKQKIFIYQPFIPVIPGKKPFPSRVTALRTAKTVKAKLMAGQRPDLTIGELAKAGIDSLGNSN
jgi:hypothetical protein